MSAAARRLAREWDTIVAMIRIYCRDRHGVRGLLCDDCRALRDYAERRLVKCPFGDEKPTCVNCPVHCYEASMRDRVREVMRHSGPKMLTRHPLLALAHLVDGRRPLSEKAQRVAERRRAQAAASGGAAAGDGKDARDAEDPGPAGGRP